MRGLNVPKLKENTFILALSVESEPVWPLHFTVSMIERISTHIK